MNNKLGVYCPYGGWNRRFDTNQPWVEPLQACLLRPAVIGT
ncbi:hypothetical protein RP726_09140 [Candidatus Methylospira mobilis]|nr:hypothetical protein [Candidatus Methylospira mobilis]WNV06553.1 hypothetical protein RP726_09140 [Candidatus Methylospira mobilis]